MINKVYGELVVIASAVRTDKHLKWLCLCSCGTKKIIRGTSLKSGITRSCGCLQKKTVTTHGGKKTRLYQTWVNMRRRCNSPNSKDYKNYGGRGITYTKLWDNFEVFKNWAINTGYTDELTIDRKNVNGDYTPENCKWSDWNTQASNQRKEKDKTSIYLGVSKRNNKWVASAKRLGTNYHIGIYSDEKIAATERDNYIKFMGWPHKLNF